MAARVPASQSSVPCKAHQTGLGNGGQNILKLHRLRQNQPIPAGSGQHLKLPKMVTTTET